MSCDGHIKCVAYDTEVPTAEADGPDGCTFVATLTAAGLLQVRASSAAGAAVLGQPTESKVGVANAALPILDAVCRSQFSAHSGSA